MRIATLLLAAGSSSRMGRPKQTLPVGDRTLLEITLDAASALEDTPVYVVTGAPNAEIDAILEAYPGAERRCNERFAEGMGGSLALLVASVPEDVAGYLVLLCDQPDLTTDYLATMIAAFRSEQGRRIHATVWPEGGRMGPPIIWPASFRNELLRLEGDRGARDVLRVNRERVVLHQPPVPLVDLDTEAEYLAYLAGR